MMGNTQHMEEQLLQQQHLQQHQNLRHQLVLQQEEFLRMQELQKRNNFATQINGPANGRWIPTVVYCNFNNCVINSF